MSPVLKHVSVCPEHLSPLLMPDSQSLIQTAASYMMLNSLLLPNTEHGGKQTIVLLVKPSPSPVLIIKVLLEYRHLICLHIVYGYFLLLRWS